jgi:RHS repeat-associated protein
LQQRYNQAGSLEQVTVDNELYIERIAYSAKGQRLLIVYGNAVMTRYAYDTRTFRLARMRTERYVTPVAFTYQPAGSPLQDSVYEYDLIGNIMMIRERTPGCGVTNTLAGPDALDRSFIYDPLYRLLSATGRECDNIAAPRPWPDDNRCGFNSPNHGTPDQDNAPNLSSLYREDYAYDPSGNMVSLRHTGNNAWTRHFGMGGLSPQQWQQEWQARLNAPGVWPNPAGNQLTHVGDDDLLVPQSHFFDASGNLIRQTMSHHFGWDHDNRMRVYRTQTAGAEPSVHAQYLYNSNGQRVKKLIRRAAGNYDVTVYIDGSFQHHRQVRPGQTRENNSLHVMDNRSRIAVVRVGTAFPDDGAPNVRTKYHLGDHLESCAIVIGGANAAASAFINREEYFPYGETSFGSFARKQYRFTGRERDEESGLYHHGARYYASWLGRWITPDPAGIVESLNLYSFVRANPLRFNDPTGLQGDGAPEKEQVRTSSVTGTETSSITEPSGEPPIPNPLPGREERQQLIRDYARTLAADNKVSSVEALARIADFTSKFHRDEPRNPAEFVDDLFDVLTELQPGIDAYLPIDVDRNKRVLLGQTGFERAFQEEKGDNNPQVRHFVGWLYFGFNMPRLIAIPALHLSETTDPSEPHTGASTYPDFVLGIAGIALGVDLALPVSEPGERRPLGLEDVGDWIRVNVGSATDPTLSPVPEQRRAFLTGTRYGSAPSVTNLQYGPLGRDLAQTSTTSPRAIP